MLIGSSESEITPKLPVELSGYGYYLGREATSVESPLKASVMSFESDDGTQAAICGVDLISVGQDTVSRVGKAVEELSDGKYANTTILINPSHTHSGPASLLLRGAGEYNPGYVDNILLPELARGIVTAFETATEGEIGIARVPVEGLSYNRTDDDVIDSRVTSIRADTQQMVIGGLHFVCHPVVYGKNSTVISSEYPGYAREVFKGKAGTDAEIWLSGCYGDTNPLVIKKRQNKTTQVDVEELGAEIGRQAAELFPKIATSAGKLCVQSTVVEVPVNINFELDPLAEAEVYRESRRLPKDQDLGPLTDWLKQVAPAVNADPSITSSVPVTLISIGRIVFAGFGAEVYSQTGVAIEQQFPSLQIVTLGSSNDNKGYIPIQQEYDRHSYAARSSSFIFGRKPLTPNSEEVFRKGVNTAIEKLIKSAV